MHIYAKEFGRWITSQDALKSKINDGSSKIKDTTRHVFQRGLIQFRYAEQYPNLKPFIAWLKAAFSLVKTLPDFLVPKYFSLVMLTVYHACVQHCLQSMPESIETSGRLVQSLSLGFYQMCGSVSSAKLMPMEDSPASLAAGLPHFSTRHMRCWGRDVFISLRGLTMLTGQWQVAKNHLIAFASVVRHGLVPNLLDSGRYPRYNARDATW